MCRVVRGAETGPSDGWQKAWAAAVSTRELSAPTLRPEFYARWRCARWPLLSFVVTVHLLLILTSPMTSSEEALAADLSAGRVRTVDVVVGELSPAPGHAGFLIAQGSPVARGDVVAWTTTLGLSYQVDRELFRPGGRTTSWSPDTFDLGAIDVRRSAAATARANGHDAPGRGSGTAWPRTALAFLALLTVLGAVGLLISGPEPRLLTRWGWFWLLSLPAGLGLVWYLVREAPWNARTSTIAPLPPGRTRHDLDGGPVRRGGWTGLVAAAVFGGLVTVLLTLGQNALLDHHPGSAGQWHLVDERGRTMVSDAAEG